jgi:hypothetical protein
MKKKVMYLLVVILVTLVLFPKEITFATFPIASDFDEPKIVIITPCSRPQNLTKIKESIDLSKIKRWYISYDCQDNKMEYVQRYPNEPKIKELKCTTKSMSGNGPRNMALDEIAKNETGDRLIYFLDDDTTLHPDMLKKDFKMDTVYTWDMERYGAPYVGNNPTIGFIDTGHALIDMNIIGENRWRDTYDADGVFITNILNNNKEKWVYIPETLAIYNHLNSPRPK